MLSIDDFTYQCAHLGAVILVLYFVFYSIFPLFMCLCMIDKALSLSVTELCTLSNRIILK